MEVFEALMIIAFGVSWPVSLYKSVRSKTAKGKSVIFMTFVLVGYAFGIFGKIYYHQVTYVLFFYALNFLMVLADILFYFRNRALDAKREKGLTGNYYSDSKG